MKRLVIVLSLILLICGTVSIASAAPVDFLIGDDNSIFVISDDSTITADLSQLPDTSFQLSESQSFTFNYAVNIDVTADAGTYDIIADLEFILPLGVGVVGSDGTLSVTVKGMGRCGRRNCTPYTEFEIDFYPVDVTFGNGGLFTLELIDVVTQWNSRCKCYVASDELITATVTLITAPVSEPGLY